MFRVSCFATAGVTLLLAPIIPWALAGLCKMPDENDELCYSPSDAVEDCNGYPGCIDMKIYTINPFPTGPVDSEMGSTTEKLADCWQAKTCTDDPQHNRCVASSLSPWHQVAKTVIKDEFFPDCSE